MEPVTDWKGRRARLGGRLLNSKLRRLADRWFLGDSRARLIEATAPALTRGDETVLEVGAGSGYHTLALAGRLPRGRVVCLDLSADMLAILEQKAARQGLNERVELRCREAADSGLEEGEVDAAVSCFVLHELPEAGSALAEMYRALRPGGALVLLDFVKGAGGHHHGAHAHGAYTSEELVEQTRAVGFSDVDAQRSGSWVLVRGRK